MFSSLLINALSKYSQCLYLYASSWMCLQTGITLLTWVLQKKVMFYTAFLKTSKNISLTTDINSYSQIIDFSFL